MWEPQTFFIWVNTAFYIYFVRIYMCISTSVCLSLCVVDYWTESKPRRVGCRGNGPQPAESMSGWWQSWLLLALLDSGSFYRFCERECRHASLRAQNMHARVSQTRPAYLTWVWASPRLLTSAPSRRWQESPCEPSWVKRLSFPLFGRPSACL